MFQEMLYLVKHGVPWDVVRSWSKARRMGACVALAEQDGFVFDWSVMQYRDDRV